MKVIAINGSPRMEKGHTALILTSFIHGMTDAGAEVELFYIRRLKVKPCTCGEMYCARYKRPGECCIKDDMQLLYPQLKEADILKKGRMNKETLEAISRPLVSEEEPRRRYNVEL